MFNPQNMEVGKLCSKMYLTRKEYVAISNQDNDCYYSVNGQLIRCYEDLHNFDEDVSIRVHYRLFGGKGGFGSMLRAIGNQIEKTNNNDMCRDLSGRRIRDVNAEAKLKEWYANAGKRERAELDKFLEKQKRRREALSKGPLHNHKFDDPEFSQRKEHISAELQEAVEDMLKKIVAESGPVEPSSKRRKLWIETIDGDELSSSDVSDNEDDGVHSDDSLPDSEPGPSTSICSHDPVETFGDVDASIYGYAPTKKFDHSYVENELYDVPDPAPEKSLKRNVPDFVRITDEILGGASSASELELYGMESLKEALASRGLKCGGTLAERACRLFFVRDLNPENYPVKLLAGKLKH